MKTQITLLDGGMGQELRHRSAMPATPLWSMQVLLDEPHLVEAVHRDYIAAGAEVITLASYSSTPERLERDADAGLFEPAQEAAIAAARKALKAGGRPSVKLAGCLPPLVTSYRPDLVPDEDVCLATYRRSVATQEHAVDLFMCETMASLKEIRCATAAAVESGKPVWCGITVDDADGTVLRSGESVTEAAQAAVDAGASALLINCSFPEAVTRALETIGRISIPTGGYANAFTSILDLQPGGTVNRLEARTDLDPEAYAAHVERWVQLGATIVGGCCEVGPAHIALLARRLGKLPA